ncbi:GFA family protein [Undibacterium sp. Di27W]|uniref:GFA family protein n=1 Tax=Undibacterium sp. Di27W TaxID=3413036 RepID=UPI003BF1F6AA
MQTISGRCSCGNISYHYPAAPLQVVTCHCGMCRRMTGAAMSSYVVVKAAELVFTQGQDALKTYAVTAHTKRHFCGECGTPLFNANTEKYAGLAMLYLGTVDAHQDLTPHLALFCENQLSWLQLTADCRQFAQAPTRPPSK